MIPFFSALNISRISSNHLGTTSGIVLVVFAIAGAGKLFGTTILSFMLAGGVLLFIAAIELLIHGVWRFGGSTLPGESAVVPLAFPLPTGPGAITSVMWALLKNPFWVDTYLFKDKTVNLRSIGASILGFFGDVCVCPNLCFVFVVYQHAARYMFFLDLFRDIFHDVWSK